MNGDVAQIVANAARRNAGRCRHIGGRLIRVEGRIAGRQANLDRTRRVVASGKDRQQCPIARGRIGLALALSEPCVDGRCDGNTVHADQLHSDLQSHTLCTGSGAKLRHDGAVALPLGPDIETGGDQPGGRREIDVE